MHRIALACFTGILIGIAIILLPLTIFGTELLANEIQVEEKAVLTGGNNTASDYDLHDKAKDSELANRESDVAEGKATLWMNNATKSMILPFVSTMLGLIVYFSARYATSQGLLRQ
jgi:hypothetical protein